MPTVNKHIKKIATIVGARPQFIKLAPLSKDLRKKFNEVIIHTGQHYDLNMSGSFFTDLDIPEPDFNLGIGSADHGTQTGQMLIALEKVMLKEKPDMTVVFGDTNSTLAGALAASKLHIPAAHVEAGLRSFNKTMPEEINRIVADHCADLLFAPTKTAVDNLKNEGLEEQLRFSGDIMLDTLQLNLEKAEKQKNVLKKLDLSEKQYLLLTLHRAYTVDEKDVLGQLLESVSQADLPVVFPVHPRTQKMIRSFDLNITSKIKLIDPLGYLEFLMLQQNAAKILTDSGGIQKEAYLLGTPCITLRPETEWVETVDAGWNIVVGNRPQQLLEAIENFSPSGDRPPVFGTFPVAEKMVEEIEIFLGTKAHPDRNVFVPKTNQ
jgi:UDP-N-acetylglucosamine 2-epimerase